LGDVTQLEQKLALVATREELVDGGDVVLDALADVNLVLDLTGLDLPQSFSELACAWPVSSSLRHLP